MIKSKRKLNKLYTIGNIRVLYVQEKGGYRYRCVTDLLTGVIYGFAGWGTSRWPNDLAAAIRDNIYCTAGRSTL